MQDIECTHFNCVVPEKGQMNPDQTLTCFHQMVQDFQTSGNAQRHPNKLTKQKITKGTDLKLLLENIDSAKNIILAGKRQRCSNKLQTYRESDEEPQPGITKLGRKIRKINRGIQRKDSSDNEEVLTNTERSIFTSSQCQTPCFKNQPQLVAPFGQIGSCRTSPCLIGKLGHSTVILNEPIKEGSNYYEFKILENDECQQQLATRYSPQIRIGICGQAHRLDTPLGFGQSIGFHANRKVIIAENHSFELTQINQTLKHRQLKYGDIIGMLCELSPEYKHPDSTQIWQDSTLSFFLNGQRIGVFHGIKQMKYFPAISLYNYAKVEILTSVGSF